MAKTKPPPDFPVWVSPIDQVTIDPRILALIRQSFTQDPLPVPYGQIQGAAGLYVTGRIAANGQINAGTNFSCNRSGTGIYDITYTVAFAVEPVVTASLIGDPDQSGAVVYGITAHAATGFTIQWKIVGAADQNQAFMFISYLTR